MGVFDLFKNNSPGNIENSDFENLIKALQSDDLALLQKARENLQALGDPALVPLLQHALVADDELPDADPHRRPGTIRGQPCRNLHLYEKYLPNGRTGNYPFFCDTRKACNTGPFETLDRERSGREIGCRQCTGSDR